MKKYILVLITAGSSEEGERIGSALVKENLAACCNIVPEIKSIFTWKGKICKEKEVLLLVKSKSPLFERLKKRVKELHSYEVPEIIAISIEKGLPDYFKWMDETLTQSSKVKCQNYNSKVKT